MQGEMKRYIDRLSEVKAVIQCAHDSLSEKHDPVKNPSDGHEIVTLAVALKLWSDLDAEFRLNL